MRQPEHVVLAGELGLGVFPRDRIEYRKFRLEGMSLLYQPRARARG